MKIRKLLAWACALATLVGCGAPAVTAPAQTPEDQQPEPVATNDVPPTPDRLTIVAPQGVKVLLYSGGSTDGTPIPAESAAEQDDKQVLLYAVPRPGMFCCVMAGEGYYSSLQIVRFAQEEAVGGKVVSLDPGKRTEGEYQPTDKVTLFAPELLETALSVDHEKYADVFTTPVFTTERALHQQTTHEEMMAFLNGLDARSEKMHLFTLGKSPTMDLEIPVAVLSSADLSSAKTLEDAAAILHADGKPIIHYQAQIHGREPASCEGALSVLNLLCGAYGETVLQKVNIYVVPRINAEGAVKYRRTNLRDDIDMNRDHLLVKSAEVELIHGLYDLFLPEVTIDGHEYQQAAKTEKRSDVLDDVLIGAAGSLNSGKEINERAWQIAELVMEKFAENGLRAYPYSKSANGTVGRVFYGLCGSLSFLVETCGIGAGLQAYDRRVLSQTVAARTIIDYTVQHAEEVKKSVADERQRLVSLGATYEEDDLVVLEHGASKSKETTRHLRRDNVDFLTGRVTESAQDYSLYDTAKRSRPRPTAYVIPKGEPWTENAMAPLRKNHIEYRELPAGSTVRLVQYLGDSKEATLAPEKPVTFPNGAYVLPMDQIGANVLALTLEPDVTDSKDNSGTLLQSKIVTPAADGTIPIYRYVHDLAGASELG